VDRKIYKCGERAKVRGRVVYTEAVKIKALNIHLSLDISIYFIIVNQKYTLHIKY